MTPQGRAIMEASVKFGDGETLPFTPCKKGYIPVIDGLRMYACRLHNEDRKKRLAKENGKFRRGEMNLEHFWKQTKRERDE